ncbi:hypothetical protein MMC25_003108 [Agyrium rufum]|nr:hypothetical protein [Agyrium rufum]
MIYYSSSLIDPHYQNDAFVAPTLPALTPHGFVRWQTIQLLLDPGEHVPILQEAVKRFDIINPGEGGSFPRFLPKEALPSKPDEAILLWHDNSLASLREVSQLQKPSLNRQGRDPVDDVASITDSSADTHSIVDAADYFDAEEQSTSSTRPPRIEFPPPMLEQKKARSKRGLDYYHSSNRPNKASSEGSTQPDSDSDVQTPNDTNSQPYKPGRSRRQLLQPDTLGCDTMTAQPVQRLNRRTTHRDADNARAEMPPKEPELSPTLDGRGRRHSANNLYDATLGHGSRWEDGANGLSPQFYAASRPKSKDGYFPEMSQQQRPRPVWKDVLHQPTGSGSGTVSPKRHQSVQFVEADQARRKETDRHDRW